MIRTVVCDDEPPALDLIAALFRATGEIEIVGAFLSAAEALGSINAGGVELAIFDVEMPEMTGVDAFRAITVEPRPLLIFATAHPEYAVEAFGVDAIDYILKPLDPRRVGKAVEKAVRLRRLILERDDDVAAAEESHAASLEDVLKIKDAGKVFFIPHHDIIWIEAAGDYSIIHTAKAETTVRATVKTLEGSLPHAAFLRVHRSAILATAQVREIRLLPKGEAQISMSDGAIIRSSRSYRDVVQSLATAPRVR